MIVTQSSRNPDNVNLLYTPDQNIEQYAVVTCCDGFACYSLRSDMLLWCSHNLRLNVADNKEKKRNHLKNQKLRIIVLLHTTYSVRLI